MHDNKPAEPQNDYFKEWNEKAKTPLQDDAYSAGQLYGMIFIIELIEKNKGIDKQLMQKLKMRSAEGLSRYLKKPPEDVLLMVETIMEETGL